ncbi:hypothetical protein IEN92_01645 [Polynucleobacter sp. MWH-Creno-3A4]|uniref:hypothetical protein n=1 Tax=Polynucleobacter sp. MWH-Creno-3A4 TaxID=1855886 RepID=UPI001C0C9906|nr:hypothetical protein [Polynucleobacter sp. MWH-Creno-3A4]MBU3605455.1 hypothetical protein [Polynucleobacter sp. MWH-Creno-3A4]
MKFSQYFVVLLSVLLSACANDVGLNFAHSYTGDNALDNPNIIVTKQDVLISKDQPLSSMTFAISDQVQAKLPELAKRGFSQEQFAQTIKTRLINAGLLDEAGNSGLKLELNLVDAYLLTTTGSIILASQGTALDWARYNYSQISAIIKDAQGNVLDNYMYSRYTECDYCDTKHRAQNVYDVAAALTVRAISVKGH